MREDLREKGFLNGAVQVVHRPPKIIFRSKWKCFEIESSLIPPFSVFYRVETVAHLSWTKKSHLRWQNIWFCMKSEAEATNFYSGISGIGSISGLNPVHIHSTCQQDHPVTVYSGHASRYENWELLSVTFSVHWSVNQFIPQPRRAPCHPILDKWSATSRRSVRWFTFQFAPTHRRAS